MPRETILIILGILVILSPFSGLPLAWLSWILPIIGLLMIIIGISLHRRHRTLSGSGLNNSSVLE